MLENSCCHSINSVDTTLEPLQICSNIDLLYVCFEEEKGRKRGEGKRGEEEEGEERKVKRGNEEGKISYYYYHYRYLCYYCYQHQNDNYHLPHNHSSFSLTLST